MVLIDLITSADFNQLSINLKLVITDFRISANSHNNVLLPVHSISMIHASSYIHFGEFFLGLLQEQMYLKLIYVDASQFLLTMQV